MTDILCPYCLNKLSSINLERVCDICGHPDDRMVPLRLFDRISRDLPPSISKYTSRQGIKIAPKCRQDGCSGKLSSRRCGYCKTVLPPDILDYEKYLRFSIVGMIDVGKTNFLTIMLHEVVHKSNPDFPMVFSYIEDSNYEQYSKMIYEQGIPAPSTPKGVTPPPQIWRIKDKSRMTDQTIPSHCMIIFDGAGEDCEHIDPVISRYIIGSKALIILVDPLDLPNVRAKIPKDVQEKSRTTVNASGKSEQMVKDMTDYIRKNFDMSGSSLVGMDVAIVFTKIDMVRSQFDAATVMKPSPHMEKGGFVKKDADAVNEEIRDWLIRQGEKVFVDSVETNFGKDRIRYFGVSSFGQPPVESQKLGKIFPHRVLDPIFWMMSKEGIVPVIN